MSGEADHARARDLFLEVLDRPLEERSAHLDRVCGEDGDLRREVESLLEHHDPVSLFEEQGSTGSETEDHTLAPRPGGSSPTWRSSSHFMDATRRLLWVVAAALALVGLGLWTHSRIEHALVQLQATELETVVQAKVAALDVWIEEQRGQLELAAADPRVLSAARELLDIGQGLEREAAAVAWRRDPARQRLLELSERFAERTHSRRTLGLADRRGVIVFSSSEAEVGIRVNAEGRHYLTRALEGEAVFVRPYRMGDLIDDYTTGTMYTWVVTPLQGARGGTLGVLTASQNSYGPSSISAVLAAGAYTSTLEVYAFDGRALMLSESRFTEELRAVGAAPPVEDARGTWDAGTQLNVSLRDPGGDLLQGHVPDQEPSARPLTALAARALAALDGSRPLSGVVLTPYRNYRGAEVIGAWRWLPEHGFGVAAEVETGEILAPLRYLDLTFGVLFVLLCVFVATTLASTFSVVSLRRRMKKLRILGPYHLGEVLGRGGMGTVFLAEHALLKRRTAVKTLSQSLSPEAVARFEQEVRVASQLTHPNTIEIYDFGRTEEGVFYYAMEYVEGVTLAELVRENGPLPPERAVHLLLQVCASLGEAHRRGLVHQDIKPQNVMVCERGGDYDVVKVLDFGLVARSRAADTQLLSRRRGTPLYMAPERVTGSVWADARADVYSVGAVAYYLLTGRPVFEATSLADLLHAVVNEEPAPLAGPTAASIPLGLQSLVADCLAKDPEDRPQSVFAIRERLDSLTGLGEWTQAAALEWWEGRLVTPREV